MSDSDSDEDNIFGFSSGNNLVIEEEEDINNNGSDINKKSLFGNIVNALICDDMEYLKNTLENNIQTTESNQIILECSIYIILGEYSSAALKIETPEFNMNTLLNALNDNNNFDPINTIRTSIIAHIAEGNNNNAKEERVMNY